MKRFVKEDNPADIDERTKDIWKLLWHSDVKKDHKHNYDQDVVDSLLPDTLIKTDLFGPRNPKGSPVLNAPDLEVLFNFVVKNNDNPAIPVYDNLFNNSVKKINVFGKLYNVKIIDNVPKTQETYAGDFDARINEAIQGNKLTLFIDTSNHTDLILNNAVTQVDGAPKNIVYAYTRATENDAAGKMNLKTSTSDVYRSRLYYESVDPGATQSVTYPNYTAASSGIGLSHFYCKYPVTLTQLPSSAKQRARGGLNITMHYTKDGNTVEIPNGGNMASGTGTVKNKIKKALGITLSKESKELLFIAKHHGDVAQVLDKYRLIPAENYTNGDKYTIGDAANNSQSCFVSIDVNAITKAFTVGIDNVWFYSNEKHKLCMFIKESDPRNELAYLSSETTNLILSLIKEIDLYNSNVTKLVNRHTNFNTKVIEEFTRSEGNDLRERYINVIRSGIRIATLCAYVPKNDNMNIIREIEYGVMLDYEKEYDQIAAVIQNPTSIEQVNEYINKLKEYRRDVLKIRDLFVVPSHFLSVNVFDAIGNLAKTSLEKDFMFELRQGGLLTYKNIDNLWIKINIDQDPTSRSVGALCGIGTKYTNNWALDLILQSYQMIANYNIEYAKLFIRSLRSVLEGGSADQRAWFDDGLRIINITDYSAAPAVGAAGAAGSPYLSLGGKSNWRKTAKKGGNGNNNMGRNLTPNRRRPVNSLLSAAPPAKMVVNATPETRESEATLTGSREASRETTRQLNFGSESFIRAVEEELSDIGHVLRFYKEIADADDDKETILKIHNDFFRRIYDLDEGMAGGAKRGRNESNSSPDDPEFFEPASTFYMTVPKLKNYENQLDELSSYLESISEQRFAGRIEELQKSLCVLADYDVKEESLKRARIGGGTRKHKVKQSRKRAGRYTNRTYKK